jgi:RHS repeat-associated protein
MIRDDNKNIQSIVYNHLNLPTKIVFQNGGDFPSISYLYTATGKKVAKTVNIASRHSITYTVDYLDGYQYESGKLLFFPTAEGYVKYTFGASNPFDYVFNYTDHLGNVRLSYGVNPGTGLLTKIEENNYYPFGLKHGSYNTEAKIIVPRPEPGADTAVSGKYMVQKVDVLAAVMEMPPMELPPGELITPEVYSGYNYKYQGQELQDELGLNWYSFKWRNYDPAIGRFMNIDPLSEKYAYQSHYNFSENRVVDGRELEGLEVQLINPTKSASTEQQKVADQRIVNGSKNTPNNSTLITVTGHGNPNYIKNDVRNEKITTGKQLDAVLSRNSDDWKNREGNDGMTVVLYSCRTGANEKNKDGSVKDSSVAQQISASDEFKDVEIIAPDQRVYFTEDGLVGTYEAEYAGPNDEYKADAKDHSRSDTTGNWNVFKNGELIRSYQGNWTPTNNPSWWDNLTKKN